jgi:hypothetical protein
MVLWSELLRQGFILRRSAIHVPSKSSFFPPTPTLSLLSCPSLPSSSVNLVSAVWTRT